MDTIRLCFLCDVKLKGRCIQMSTGITPHGNVPYLEKICEVLGEEFVIIVNSTDHICVKCTSLLIRMDKLENEVKLVKNAMLSFIQNKYGISPPDQAVKSIENVKMLNENLMVDKQPNPGQLILPNGLPVRKIPTIVFTPVKTPIRILKIQPQQKQKPQQVENEQQLQKQHQDGANRMKILKCSTHVQLQKPTHLNQKQPEKPIVIQTTASKMLIPVPQMKKLNFRCQVCSKCYDSRSLCLEHIKKAHKQPTTLIISNNEKEIIYSCPDTANISKLHLTSQKNNQKMESPTDINDSQQDDKKGTVDTDVMSNYNVPTKKFAYTEQEEETDDSLKVKTVKESKSIKIPDLANKEEEEKEEEKNKEYVAKPEKDAKTPTSIKKEFDEDTVNM